MDQRNEASVRVDLPSLVQAASLLNLFPGPGLAVSPPLYVRCLLALEWRAVSRFAD